MVKHRLIRLTSVEFPEDQYLIAQQYVRLVWQNASYLTEIKNFMLVTWTSANELFNERGTYSLKDLRGIIPLPYDSTSIDNPASWYRDTYNRNVPYGFSDICYVLLFYKACNEYVHTQISLLYEDIVIQISKPVEDTPEIKHRYSRETFELAATYVLELTNDGKYYSDVCEWFKHNTVLDSKVVPPHYFPYKATGYYNSYTKALNKSPAQDRQKFAALVRQMLFNHYSESRFGVARSDTFNIHFIEEHQEPRTECNQPIQQQIANHLAKAEAHFTIVENKMNTLTKFEKQVSATVHLIHGRPADDYSESELMALIREAQKNKAALADLVDASERMKAKSAQYDADIAVYVAALDALK